LFIFEGDLESILHASRYTADLFVLMTRLHHMLRDFSAGKPGEVKGRKSTVCVDKHFVIQPLQGLRTEAKVLLIKKAIEVIENGGNPYETIKVCMSTSNRMKRRHQVTFTWFTINISSLNRKIRPEKVFSVSGSYVIVHGD